MKIRQFTHVAILGMLIGISLGCTGQPRVTVITSTMVGLEAKPPMGDAQPNPSVSLAYKRAEMALVPVCRVPEYSWWQEFMEWLGIRDNKTPEPSTSPIGTKNDSAKVGSTVGKAGQQSSSKCPSKGSNGEDAYTVLGSFQMAHNWFGPLNIRQFIATGMAARHLVTPTIHVIGEVMKPGIYPFKSGLTAEDAIAMAGGRTKDASDDTVDLFFHTKDPDKRKSVKPDTTIIESNTVVEVPQVDWIHISGDVKKPGRHRYEKGMTREKALESAGGTDTKGKLKVTATQTDKTGTAGASRELSEKGAVLPGDIIVVAGLPLQAEDNGKNKPGASQEATQPAGATTGSKGGNPTVPESTKDSSKGSSEK
jgi:SLBB domain